MHSYSIGLLETEKYSTALKALDSMLKTSKVSVFKKKVVTEDFAAVIIQGESSAVKSALDNGILKVKREGEICSSYIIDNPRPELINII